MWWLWYQEIKILLLIIYEYNLSSIKSFLFWFFISNGSDTGFCSKKNHRENNLAFILDVNLIWLSLRVCLLFWFGWAFFFSLVCQSFSKWFHFFWYIYCSLGLVNNSYKCHLKRNFKIMAFLPSVVK